MILEMIKCHEYSHRATTCVGLHFENINIIVRLEITKDPVSVWHTVLCIFKIRNSWRFSTHKNVIFFHLSMGEAFLLGGQKEAGSRARGQGVLPLLSLPSPFLSPFPLPIPFLPFSLPFPFPLEVGTPIAARGSGERLSSPSESGRSPVAKRILMHFRPKFMPFLVPNAAY